MSYHDYYNKFIKALSIYLLIVIMGCKQTCVSELAVMWGYVLDYLFYFIIYFINNMFIS